MTRSDITGALALLLALAGCDAVVTVPDSGAKSSDTAFTDSIVPKARPLVSVAPTSGSSTYTTSPSCC